MIRIVRAATVSAIIAGGALVAMGGAAHADGKTTVKSLKDKGYSCEHAATNMTVCTKTGEKDQTCSESEDSCAVLFRVHNTRLTVVVPRSQLATTAQ